jgi:hypothetical protein
MRSLSCARCHRSQVQLRFSAKIFGEKEQIASRRKVYKMEVVVEKFDKPAEEFSVLRFDKVP